MLRLIGVFMNPANVYKIAVLAVSLLGTFGCQRLMNQDAAVQKAIQDHLAERSDLAMDKMVMAVQHVNINGDTAQAEVVFTVAGDTGSRMSFQYDLQRESGRWKVTGGHPTASQVAHPPMGNSPGDGGMPGETGNSEPLSLPEGHPPVQQMNPHGEEPPPSAQQ
jgi:hypothetical protein